jgi:uncharacterized protein YqiB (DUF1249 family)
MLADSYILPECIVRPGSFGGLMVLYEANFIKLNQLVGALPLISAAAVSNSADDSDLHLTVEDKTKYTCHIRLTYFFAEGADFVAEPDLVAKVYFDARMVEVTGWVDAPHHQLLGQFGGHYHRPLDERWSRNMMLGKWLDYLLDKGHQFRCDTPVSL